MNWLIIVIAAYLVGSISPAILISKYIKKRDVREVGSGNAGSTNMARVFGMKTGALAFVCDVLKTFLALFIGQILCGQMGIYVAAACCFMGHCKPIYYHFKGGKGVTCAAMIVLGTDWRVFLITALVFFVLFFWKRIVSLASITAVSCALIAAMCLRWGDTPYLCLIAYLALFVLFFHKRNIERLLKGEEAKFTVKSGES